MMPSLLICMYVCVYICVFSPSEEKNMVVGLNRSEISDTPVVWLTRAREISALHNDCFGSQYKSLVFLCPIGAQEKKS